MRTLTEQAAAVARREVSPVELVEDALARIEQVRAKLNAFTSVMGDEALARAKQLADIDPVGPLHGVPIAIKDLYDVEGLPTTGCCNAFAERIASSDSAVVAKLRAAGAIVVAKTNQHEMACGATNVLSSSGAARNPWDASRITGGSSGGSGAAVAGGVVAMAMGSDTGGSIRIPSAFCGVTGLKPTHGAVSLRGAMSLTPSLDTAGPLAVSAKDCTTVFEVIAGFDADDDWSRPRPSETQSAGVSGPRIAVLQRFSAMARADVRKGVDDAATTLATVGAVVEQIDGPDPDEAWNAIGPIFVAEFAACYPGLADDDRAHPEVRSLVEAGNAIPGTVYANSRRAAHRFRREFLSVFDRYDAVIAPTTPYAAPRADEREVDIGGRTIDVHSGGPARLTMPVNLAGIPAVAFPVGFSSDGLPIGAQLIGPEWSEVPLCSMVAAYQQTTNWHLRVPPG